jgi:hypothetical protein
MIMEPTPALYSIRAPLGIEVVTLKHDHRCIVFTDPGEHLGKKTFGKLYEILEQLSESVFGRETEMKRYWAKRKKAKFLEKLEELYLIINKESNIVGFNGWFHTGEHGYENIYVDVIGILAKKEHSRLIPDFLKSTLLDRVFTRYGTDFPNPVYVTTRTQNPSVYSLALGIVAGDLYPQIPTAGGQPAPVPPEMLQCAQDIAITLGIKNEKIKVNGKAAAKELQSNFVWKNAYNAPLYKRGKGFPGNDPINIFFSKQLDEHDAFILIGCAKIPKPSSASIDR